MTHRTDATRTTSVTPGTGLPRAPRPRPRSHEPRPLAVPLARMLPGPDAPPAPGAVRAAFALWLTAAAAGVFMTAVGGLPLLPLLPLHMAVLSATVLVAVRMRRGARWARWALACGLGVTGTLSALDLKRDSSLHAVFTGGSARWPPGFVDALSGVGCVLHLAAALTATVLMCRPAANAWFRAARSR
ncbi:hypothetical protein [Streptomyces sp. KL118A]|uniref:hypothetical protein n=1 Tax=Streptomyces sp. KL118A TaxID=3045153 RepID=UPI00278C24F5|nr:hypothetical protein [Streptomyces sp. KL118A]